MTPTTKCTADDALKRVSEGSLVVDSDWKVTNVDRGAEDLLDLDPSTKGDSLWEVLPQYREDGCEQRVREAMETSRITEFECYSDSNEAWYRVFCCPSSTGLGLYLKEVRDDLEEQNDLLEDKNEQLLLINRIVRHDIRNDMAVVQGWAGELDGHVDSHGEDMLQRIDKTTRHAIRLTESAQDFVKLLTEGTSNRLERISLRETVGEQVERSRSMFGEAVIHVEEIPDVDVTGNALLMSVFNNLIGNAVEHNDKDQPHVDIGFELADDRVDIEVADNGPGVPQEERDAVFGRGRKGLEASAAGLGLRLVDTVVRECGGYVSVGDNDPEGSVFKVELPLAGTSAGGEGYE